MQRRTLADWLDYQLRLHPQAIALGLDRVRSAWQALGAPCADVPSIVVAGTNGKGSTVAYLESILRASGRRTGAYTSPHLLRYAERVRLDGREAGDDALVAAFARIERARKDVPLTYFEFGTLAALCAFAEARVDVAVLEVGLGGRLDAVNIVDGAAAIVTTIDLDHQALLGDDREQIAREKAGVWRAGRPAIVAERAPPAALLHAAHERGARVVALGRDYDFAIAGDGWRWSHADGTQLALPAPGIAGPAQHANAAGAVAALHALRDELPVEAGALRAGVGAARLRGRLERVAEAPEIVVDVAHNVQAAATLAAWLDAAPPRRTLAVFAALKDKDVAAIAAAIGDRVAAWHVAGLERDSDRGAGAAETAARLG
ncbi:MAG TPA: folylpolyglutamate synthase/dihydrofolate synthase family protein, partial [Xanthomonadales bacterium]|nr:folylpolyglutamate synthase/dihydrofolate synthase family protein [Xanthomonadales bacterium]